MIIIGQRGSLLHLLPSRAQIFSRARSESGRCFMFSAQKRARERELDFSPAKNCIESRHFGANYLRLCCVCRRELSKYKNKNKKHILSTAISLDHLLLMLPNIFAFLSPYAIASLIERKCIVICTRLCI